MPQAGNLREYLMIQQAIPTDDGQGGRSIVWQTFAHEYAELMPLKADERLNAEAMGSHVRSRFRTRTRDDLEPEMRIQWRQSWQPAAQEPKLLEIHGIYPDPADQRMYQLIECTEVD